MKFNNKFATALLVGIMTMGITSCEDKLDIEQKGVIPVDGFYQTDADCEEAVTALYYYVKQLAQGQYSPVFVTSLLSDDCYSGASERLASDDKESINEYRYDSSNGVIEDLWEGLYVTINRANLIINNYGEGKTPIQKRAVAEAKVVRAYCNFNLVTLFGPAPLITEAIRDDYKASNSTVSELWSQVERDLQEAISSNALPVKTNVNDKSTGIRITNDFAKCLLGKTYIFESSKNGGTGANKWSEAATLLDEVINSGRYAFLENYEDYQLASNNNNCEVIFSDNKLNDASNEGTFTKVLYGWSSNFFQGLGLGNECNFLGFNFMNPSKSLVDAFIVAEGENGFRFKNTLKSYDQMLAMGVSLKTGVECYAHCGYGYWKVRMSNKNLLSGSIIFDWANDVIMRLGEVVLLSAEAHIMAGDGQGDKYINMIREKAHLPLLSGATMEDLKLEKRLELCLEGTRYQDLIRWGDAASVMGSQWDKVPNFAGKAEDGNYILNYPQVNCNTTYGFKSGKHDLLPIPLNEINVNPNIHQNPGWE